MRMSDRFGGVWRLRDRRCRNPYSDRSAMRYERMMSGQSVWATQPWLGRRGARWRWAVRLILKEMPF